jgi:hypothetical protein
MQSQTDVYLVVSDALRAAVDERLHSLITNILPQPTTMMYFRSYSIDKKNLKSYNAFDLYRVSIQKSM